MNAFVGATSASAREPDVVAYFRPRPHPYANTSLENAIQQAFPDSRRLVVDVVDVLRRDRSALARTALTAVLTYRTGLVDGRWTAKQALWRTPLAFDLLRRTAHRALEELDVPCPDLTLQVQSLFDAHVDGVPHLVYTDHTHLSNLRYADFDARRLYTDSWIDRERTIYERAAACLVRSSHVARSLIEDYGVPAARVHLARAGVNAEATAGPARPEASRDIVFVGVDWERKGGRCLVEAFRRVRRIVPDATLTVVGCSPSVAGAGVRVIGRVPLSEVSGHLAAAAVFCLPTTVEPFGIAFLEAMAHGLPVVGTNVGAVPDMVEHGVNGLLVPTGDVPAISDALVALLTDPGLRRTMGERSRRAVQKRWTWSAVAARLRVIGLNARAVEAQA